MNNDDDHCWRYRCHIYRYIVSTYTDSSAHMLLRCPPNTLYIANRRNTIPRIDIPKLSTKYLFTISIVHFRNICSCSISVQHSDLEKMIANGRHCTFTAPRSYKYLHSRNHILPVAHPLRILGVIISDPCKHIHIINK